MLKSDENLNAMVAGQTYVCLVPADKSKACGGCPCFADKGRAYYFMDDLSDDAADLATFRCVSLAELVAQPGMDEQLQNASYGQLSQFEDAEGNGFHVQTLGVFLANVGEFYDNLAWQTSDKLSCDEIFEEGIESRYQSILDPEYQEDAAREWGDDEDKSFGVLADFCIKSLAKMSEGFRFGCEPIAEWADRAIKHFEKAKHDFDTVTMPDAEKVAALKAETTQYFIDYRSGDFFEYDVESGEFDQALEKTILVRQKVAVLHAAAQAVYKDFQEAMLNAGL